jgi:hypothetical protein
VVVLDLEGEVHRCAGRSELPPVPFNLEAFEEDEIACLRAAAERRFGDAERWTFETTIAAVVANSG